MGRYIMKTAPDEDTYVEWDTVTGDWVNVGTRAEMIDYLKDPERQQHPTYAGLPADAEELLDRCDRTGTSVRYRVGGQDGPAGGWEDPTIQIQNVGTIKRTDLGKYIDAVLDGDDDLVTSLITPLPRDD